MTVTDTIVAEAKKLEKALAGTPGEDLMGIVAVLTSDDWSSAALDAVGAGLAVGEARTNPLRVLVGAGAGWAIEHLDPLTRWADELTGDPEEVARRAEGLLALSGELVTLAADVRRDADRALDGQWGRTVTAYDRALQETARQVDQTAASLSGVAGALEQASVLVEAVRSFVLGLVSDIVARMVARGFLVLTGVGAPGALAWLAADVATATTRARRVMDLLVRCLEALSTRLRQLVQEVADIVATAARRQARPAPRRRGAPKESIGGRLAGVAMPAAAAATVDAQKRHTENRSDGP